MNTARATSLLILAAILTALPALAFAQTEEPDENRPGAKRPGFYLGIDFSGATYDLDDAVMERLTENGIDLSASANGGGFIVGYSWRNEFNLELQMLGANVNTGNPDVDAGLGQFNIGVHVPLLPKHRVAPYLSGHLGGTVLGFGGDAVENVSVYGGNTGVGAGVEVHLGRRWALDFGYQFSLIDFQGETIELSTGQEREVEIDGSGRMHRWAIRTVFSF